MPRLRRLRHPLHRAAPLARPGRAEGEYRLHQRDRVLRALSVLRGHVRHALDPRARAGIRHRPEGQPPGAGRVDRDRRWRRALHRRQPPHPHPAPQRGHADAAVQQRHLRPHEGPVQPYLRAGQGHQEFALRLHRRPVQPRGRRSRRGRQLRGSRHGPRPEAHESHDAASARASPAAASWRSTRTATSSTTANFSSLPRRTPRPSAPSFSTTAPP